MTSNSIQKMAMHTLQEPLMGRNMASSGEPKSRLEGEKVVARS